MKLLEKLHECHGSEHMTPGGESTGAFDTMVVAGVGAVRAASTARGKPVRFRRCPAAVSGNDITIIAGSAVQIAGATMIKHWAPAREAVT